MYVVPVYRLEHIGCPQNGNHGALGCPSSNYDGFEETVIKPSFGSIGFGPDHMERDAEYCGVLKDQLRWWWGTDAKLDNKHLARYESLGWSFFLYLMDPADIRLERGQVIFYKERHHGRIKLAWDEIETTKYSRSEVSRWHEKRCNYYTDSPIEDSWENHIAPLDSIKVKGVRSKTHPVTTLEWTLVNV